MNKSALFLPAQHEHQYCLTAAIAAAKKHCEKAGARLTSIRQRVLELIWGSHEPVKAYDLLDALKKEHPASAIPTIYRALDFLQRQGLVHKIKSMNAYVGCDNPVSNHQGQFFLCRDCGVAAELNDVDITNLIQQKAAQFQFKIDQATIEINGHCKNCTTNT